MQYPPGMVTTGTEYPCSVGLPHFPDAGNGKRQWVPAWDQGNAAKLPKLLTDVTIPRMIREAFPSAGCASGYKSFPFSFAKGLLFFFLFPFLRGEDKLPCEGGTAQ